MQCDENLLDIYFRQALALIRVGRGEERKDGWKRRCNGASNVFDGDYGAWYGGRDRVLNCTVRKKVSLVKTQKSDQVLQPTTTICCALLGPPPRTMI